MMVYKFAVKCEFSDGYDGFHDSFEIMGVKDYTEALETMYTHFKQQFKDSLIDGNILSIRVLNVIITES